MFPALTHLYYGIPTYVLAQLSGSSNAQNQMGRWIQDGGAETSAMSSRMWDDTWDMVFSSGMYRGMCIFGITIAAMSLLLWTINLAKKWMEDEFNAWHFQEIIWPVLVVFLLANNGGNLVGVCKGMREAINNMNQTVLQLSGSGMKLDQTMAELADYAGVTAQIKAIREQCNTITDPQLLNKCLQDGVEKLKAYKAEYDKAHPGSQMSKRLQAMVDTSQKALGAVINPVGAISDGLGSMTNLIWASAIAGFMYALQGAFQYLVEVSLLMTALMAPLAVGASLLPFGAKPVYAWATAMWSVGLVKLGYNLASGLTAYTMAKNGGGDDLIMATFFGLLSPILAVTLAAGGGMATFNGILAASVLAGKAGMGMGGRAIGGAASVASNIIDVKAES